LTANHWKRIRIRFHSKCLRWMAILLSGSQNPRVEVGRKPQIIVLDNSCIESAAVVHHSAAIQLNRKVFRQNGDVYPCLIQSNSYTLAHLIIKRKSICFLSSRRIFYKYLISSANHINGILIASLYSGNKFLQRRTPDRQDWHE
jgi:hypothetical protein